jgi:hypothetical protein
MRINQEVLAGEVVAGVAEKYICRGILVLEGIYLFDSEGEVEVIRAHKHEYHTSLIG